MATNGAIGNWGTRPGRGCGTSSRCSPYSKEIRLRSQLMRLLPHLPGRSKMMGGIRKAANAIELRDHP
ncbi:hypothetical protein Pme01_52860 [Planosporangium mesophilum]|uniref:Uncharacterized protein n=1 Tax=Planosporangium mesophilum TaxID=689768 RepID=A0A8J3TG82_9ACTN|nr:hypothetical protein Pme01_52860 [Planosporangium mesophilum]